MRVLHLIDSGGLYGAERVLLDLAAEQAAMGHRPVIASIGEPGCGEKEIEREAAARTLPVERFRMRSGLNVAGGAEILRYAWREGIDVLHSHGYKGNIILGAVPRRVRRLPLIATLHGYTSLDRLDRLRLYHWLDTRILPRLDRVVLVDEGVRRHPLLLRRTGIDFRVVTNGIRLPTETSAVPLDPALAEFCGGGFTFGAVGRLSPEKGYHHLLDALRQAVDRGCDLRLLLIGDGPERERLQARTAEAGLTVRVRFAGYRPDARRYLPLLRGFVLSSLTEGLPISLLEAMQARVPAVATRVGAVPEVLDHGRAGILVEPGSAESLAAGMAALHGSVETAGRLAEAAWRRVTEHYSCRRMAAEYEQIYQQLLAAGAPVHA